MIERVWTEDLPKCAHTSVANVGGEITDETLSFYCKINDNAYLYGVFEPHNGIEATRFILQRMAAEIIFNPFTQPSDEDLRDMLRNAFASVEKAYVQNYDEMIAERTSLQYQLQTLTKTQISKNCDQILERLKEIDRHLSEGVTVVIALVYNDKLLVGNVGACRALLCRASDSALRVVQLSTDHALNNDSERLRLARLGIDTRRLLAMQGVGNQTSTRCLGNYIVKGVHQAFPELSSASAEPVTPEPHIHGPVTLDHGARFLVLINSVVCKRLLEQKIGYDQINKHLSHTIVEHFRKETNFRNLSHSILRDIHDQSNSAHTLKYVPMTMLIRNFNFPMPSVEKCNVRFNPVVQSKSQTMSELRADSDSTRSSSASPEPYAGRAPLDRTRKVKGYVDFTCFYENVEKARKNGTLPSFML